MNDVYIEIIKYLIRKLRQATRNGYDIQLDVVSEVRRINNLIGIANPEDKVKF